MVVFLTISILILLAIIPAVIKSATNTKLREAGLIRLENAYKERLIGDGNYSELKELLTTKKITIHYFDSQLDFCIAFNKKYAFLLSKYDKDTATNLANDKYWIGMSIEQLIDSKGKPDRIETEQLKTKLKETYIYGNKSSGDYFVFEKGLAIKIVDR